MTHLTLQNKLIFHLQQKEHELTSIQYKLSQSLNSKNIRSNHSHQESAMNKWTKKRDDVFQVLLKLGTSPNRTMCLTSMQFQSKAVIMSGNSASIANFTDTLMHTNMMHQFQQINIHSIENDIASNAIHFRLTAFV